jgi:hypothetical protein
MAGVEGLAQGETYQQYAEKAQEQAERASNDGDRAAWLLMARSWRDLMPLLNDPAKRLCRRSCLWPDAFTGFAD